MTIFDKLEIQYNDINKEYLEIEFNARSKQWTRIEAQYRYKRELNDQAYFLFMFSRLEEKIKSETSKLIDRQKVSRASWKQKAVWNILSTQSSRDRLNFLNHLELLTEKGRADYELVARYYKERNSIAHGGDFMTEINMPTVISDFKRLYKVMKAR